MKKVFKKTTKKLKQNLLINFFKGKQISLHEIEIHTIGGLLKNFFRETKDPIIPFCYYETLLDVGTYFSLITKENLQTSQLTTKQ